MKIIYLQLEIYLVDLKEEKNVRLIPRRQEADVCVQKQPALLLQHRRFTYVHFVGSGWYPRCNCGESALSEHKANPNDESNTTAA